MLIRISALVMSVLFVSASVADDATKWQGTPGAVGDWFDAANWSNGVPSEWINDATIDNSGTARIAAGSATTGSLRVASEQSGGLLLDGGSLNAKYSVLVGNTANSQGKITVNRGSLKSQSVNLGSAFGSGTLLQNGGSVDASFLELGGYGNWSAYGEPTDFGKGEYRLFNGSLHSAQLKVGNSGVGTFRQYGGNVTVDVQLTVGGSVGAQSPIEVFHADPLNPAPLFPTDYTTSLGQPAASNLDMVTDIWYRPATPSAGTYELSSGALTSRQLLVDRTGTFRQSGGTHRETYLQVNTEGRYTLLGGTLRIESGMHVDGVFDFAHSNAALTAGSAILDLSQGITNAERARIQAGPDSLTIFAPGFRPERDLGVFQTLGLTHTAGTDLMLQPNQGFRGWGSINDHVVAAGFIKADEGGGLGGINLNDGLDLKPGANVDLASGKIQVKERVTSITGGTLKAQSMNLVGKWVAPAPELLTDPSIIVGVVAQLGLARQTSGSVELDSLNVDNGQYVINGGELRTRSITVSKSDPFTNSGSSWFTQNGGQVRAATVEIAPMYLVINYATDSAAIQQPATTNSASPSPSLMVDPSPLPAVPRAIYEIAGGSLQADQISVGSGWFDRSATFIQTRGNVDVKRSVRISGANTSYGISGGSLRTRRLEVGATSIFDFASTDFGSFSISDRSAQVTVAGELSLGGGGHFYAAPGSTINFTRVQPLDDWPNLAGNNLKIVTTDSDAVVGLRNLKVIFEGGLDSTATLEAAGRDIDSALGYSHNFTLGTLQVGGVESARLSLVDLLDNQKNGPGKEAVYVDHLIVQPGSILNLNNIHLYYRTADIAPGALVNGSMLAFVTVPEPGTAALAFLAILGCAISTKRNRRV